MPKVAPLISVTVLIMTSNVGAHEIQEDHHRVPDPDGRKGQLREHEDESDG